MRETNKERRWMTVTRGGEKSRKNVEKCTMQLTAHHQQSYCTSFTSIREDRSTTRLAARTAHRTSAPRAQHPSRGIPATSAIPDSQGRHAVLLLILAAPSGALRRTRLRLNVHRGHVRLGVLPVHRDIDSGSVGRPCSQDDVIFRRVRGVTPDTASSASASAAV
jgi:hypothetical protein